jgi:putative molybdopterin biosynthesis protein
VIERLGEALVHGVRVKPGKPVVLGIVDGTPVLGIPGNPVSAAQDMELFARPVISALQGQPVTEHPRVRVRLPRDITSPLDMEEFIRVKVGAVDEKLMAVPVKRGADTLMSLVRADGLLRIPEKCEGVHPEEEVDVEFLGCIENVKNTILAVGSHDISLDILAHELEKQFPELNLCSFAAGSIGGLTALKRREAHLAGIHLLDEETGEYNSPFLKNLLPNQKFALVNIAFREQGLVVAPGNPRNITGLEDLTRDGLSFINRQRGAGTRILLDYRLKLKGIDPAGISGYEREEGSHMAVAAAVLDGVADAGMGIMAAAQALALDFVPVATERYDLAIPSC